MCASPQYMGNRGFGAAWAKETLADPVPSLGQDKRFSGFIPESKCQYPQLGWVCGTTGIGLNRGQLFLLMRLMS